MQIVLLGYMGSGKTTIGKVLADKLGYVFSDLDALIEKEEMMSVAQIFSKKGEIYFRNTESRLLKRLVKSKDKLVIATGGGTPCYGDTINFLTSEDECLSIYLKASLDVLTQRLFIEKKFRPLIAHIESEIALNDFIRKHLFERSFYYNQAEIIIDTERDSIQSIVESIVVDLF